MRRLISALFAVLLLLSAEPSYAWRKIPTVQTAATGSVAEPAFRPLRPPVRRASLEKKLAAMRERILRLTNGARKQAGLKPLTRNPLLETSAQAYAEDMARRNFFSHSDPDGREPADRIRAAGYRAARCRCQTRTWTGENLAKGQTGITQVFRAWMNSPAHRAAILHPAFTDIGIGIRSRYWVQHFGAVEVMEE